MRFAHSLVTALALSVSACSIQPSQTEPASTEKVPDHVGTSVQKITISLYAHPADVNAKDESFTGTLWTSTGAFTVKDLILVNGVDEIVASDSAYALITVQQTYGGPGPIPGGGGTDEDSLWLPTFSVESCGTGTVPSGGTVDLASASY